MSQQKGQDNYDRFSAWYAQVVIDGNLRDYVRNGQLKKTEVAKELEFSTSTFRQNAQCKSLVIEIDKKIADDIGKSDAQANKELKVARDRSDNHVARIERQNSKLLERIAQQDEEIRQLKLQLSEIEDFKTARQAFIDAGVTLK